MGDYSSRKPNRLKDLSALLRGSRGSRPMRRRNNDLYIEVVATQLYKGYFALDNRYTRGQCRRRYRMTRVLFLRIQATITQYDDHFLQKYIVAVKIGLATCQKTTIVMNRSALEIMCTIRNPRFWGRFTETSDIFRDVTMFGT